MVDRVLTLDELHRRYQACLDHIEQEIDEGRRAEGNIQTFEEFESGYEGDQDGFKQFYHVAG